MVNYLETTHRSILAQYFWELVAGTLSHAAHASHFTNCFVEPAVDPYSAPVSDIADFHLDLSKSDHKRKPMTFSTITGFRAVIAASYFGFERGLTVSSQPVLNYLLRGIYVDCANIMSLWQMF